MKKTTMIFLLAAFVFPPAAGAAPVDINRGTAIPALTASDIDVSLRLTGGEGSVLMPGRDINLTFQTSADAYVIIYNIDSNGYVHLLYPSDGRPSRVSGRKVHFLPEPGTGVTWEVGDDTGVEYIHAVAVDDPARIDRDELYYLAQNSVLPDDKRLRIDMDPYLAFNMIDEELIEEAKTLAPATDHTFFYVNRRVDYPGYLCYQCHSPSSLQDPYAMTCPEVVIEKVGVSEDSSYPYPELYAVVHVDEIVDDDYETFSYDAGDLGAFDELDYDYYDSDTDIYLTIYDHGINPHRYYWPGYWSWYVNWYPAWYYWDPWYGNDWDMGWYAGSYYYHLPFRSWYPGYYNTYWYGYGYGWWGGWYRYDHPYYADYYWRDKRSLYAGRSLGGRRLDYAGTSARMEREKTLASSRLGRVRTVEATRRTLERSNLARNAVRDRTSRAYRTPGTSARRAGGTAGSLRRSTLYRTGISARRSREAAEAIEARRSARSRTISRDRSARSVSRRTSRDIRRAAEARRPVIRRTSPARRTPATGRSDSGRSKTSTGRSGTSARTRAVKKSTERATPTRKSTTTRRRSTSGDSRSSPTRSGSSSTSRSRSSGSRSTPARSSGSRSSGGRSTSGKSRKR